MKAKGIIIPTITLVIIALVTSVLLVVTNDATKDKIALLQEESNRAARQEVLPNADDFEESAINIDGTDYIYWKAKYCMPAMFFPHSLKAMVVLLLL